MKKTKSYKPVKTHQVPVTVELLNEVRNELVDRINSTGAKVYSVKKELKADIAGVKADIADVKADIFGVKSEIHGLRALIEEQNARNIYVLDGLANLFNRQDRLEAKVEEASA